MHEQAADDGGDDGALAEANPMRRDVADVIGGRNDIGSEVGRDRRKVEGEHRQKGDQRTTKLRGQLCCGGRLLWQLAEGGTRTCGFPIDAC